MENNNFENPAYNADEMDKLVLSSHIQNKDDDLDSYKVDDHTIEEAKKWAINANRVIVTPTDDLNELESTWIKFNEMIKKNRREADWKSLELFGCTNQEQYEKTRDHLLLANSTTHDRIQDDLVGIQGANDPLTEVHIADYADNTESYYNTTVITYTPEDVEKAKEFAADSNRSIIIPTRTLAELEELWDAYNLQIRKHKRESDWISQQYFGISNQTHYEYLKNEFLKEDIRDDDFEKYGSVIEGVTYHDVVNISLNNLNESKTEGSKKLLELATGGKTIYEEVLYANVISDVLDKFDSEVIQPSDFIDSIGYGDLPMLSSDEMIDMGVFGQSPVDNYYGANPDNQMITEDLSVKKWFGTYSKACQGSYTNLSEYSSAWVNKVRELAFGLKKLEESGDIKKINARKQSLLELGWNPDIDFTPEARALAKDVCINKMKANFSGASFKFIDLREFTSMEDENASIDEAYANFIKPVYVILVEGKNRLSFAIKKFTNSIFSHAAIAFDPTLKDMYSFGIAGSKTHPDEEDMNHAGFRKESIEDINPSSRIGVYTFFLGQEAYNKIRLYVNKFKENIKKTAYSYMNLASFALNIPINRDWKLVCSQFVDKCLKAAGINITKKNSSKVSPADIDNNLAKENKVFTLFNDAASNYDAEKASKTTEALRNTAAPLKESYSKYYDTEHHYILGIGNNITNITALKEMRNHIDIVTSPMVKRILTELVFDSIDAYPITESKVFPIEFDKEGTLLIQNAKDLDFNAEYEKSHSSLKGYAESKNYEAIKYELSKLWMILCLIENKIRAKLGKQIQDNALTELNDIKSRITNDFKYYLKEVMINEATFNFSDYYDSSPFSSVTLEINATTITFLTKLIKKFMNYV